MDTETKVEIPAKADVNYAENPSTVTYYANTAQVSRSTYDFRLRFGVSQDSQGPNASNDPKIFAAVYMSPQHAKIFSKVLAEQVRQYEIIFGEIRTAPVMRVEMAKPDAEKAD